MKVLVDTSVWSLALRKKDRNMHENRIVENFTEIIRNLDMVIIGPIRQEILSGIAEKERFEALKDRISIFEDYRIETQDYILAASLYNQCRKKGIQGSHIDYLICAVSINNSFSIFTLDKDFDNYKKIVPIKLAEIG